MRISKLLPILALIAPLSANAAVPQTGSGETDGYKLVWQDLFDAGELNPLRWNIEVNGSGGGNNELQYYTDKADNVHVGDDGQGNGCLILTAKRENHNNRNFTSGRINSKNLVAFTHGKVEASIRMPKTANGLWPAFWMMGNDFDQVGWPKCGEIDIVEMGHSNGINNGVSERFFNGAAHWGEGWPNASYARDCTKSYSIQDGEFHLFTLIWDDDELSMYVDLDKYPVQTPYYKMDINYSADSAHPYNYFHKDNFIIFNLAVGGNFPGIWDAGGITALNDENGQQASMYVNYVKVYQKETDPQTCIFTAVPGDIDESGVETAEAFAAPEVSADGRTITLAEQADITVFSIGGMQVASAVAAKEISLESLPAGLYIVKAGKEILKIFVR